MVHGMPTIEFTFWFARKACDLIGADINIGSNTVELSGPIQKES